MEKGTLQISLAYVLVILLTVCLVGTAFAQEGKPKLVTVATFDIGASGYAEMSAINDAIFKNFQVKIRNMPIGNSVARAIATRSGTTMLWQSCSAYYPCAEGLDDFASLQWGPQPLRVVFMSNRKANFSLATSKKSGIKTVADVKGKRVGWIVGNPAINMQTEAYLAYGGLTRDDVELVEFPGYTASLRGLISGKADVVMAACSSTGSYEIESSPVGLQWIPFPHDNKDGWAKIQDKASFVAPVVVTSGAGIAKGESLEAGTYPCPVVVAYDKQDANIVYWMTKMIAESWEQFKGNIDSGPYWNIDECLQARLAVPFHDGAVKYFKEVGKWTDELEKRQQYLVKRQQVLAAAFEKANDDFLAAGKKSKEFKAFWDEQRIKALTAENMSAY